MPSVAPCCGPCSRLSMCAVNRSCCVECHFAFEEQHAMPYLPYRLQVKLRDQHRTLIARGLKPDEVLRHSQEEMVWFRRYVPEDIVKLIEHDHVEYEVGVLRSRNEMRL